MNTSFRGKVMLLAATATLALLVVIGGSAALSAEREETLADVESRLVPKLRLGQEVEAEFDKLRRGMQDAVSAQDMTALDETLTTRSRLLELVGTPGVLEPSEVVALRDAIQRYDDAARVVSRQMLSGETGEGIVTHMRDMQARQTTVTALIKKTASLNRTELAAGFAALRAADQRADRFRLGIGGVSLALFLGLWLSVSRGLVDAVSRLSDGFQRFGDGTFETPIDVVGKDELAEVARQANVMATNLHALNAEREQADLITSVQVELAEELRGELSLSEVGTRTLALLCGKLDARAAALYVQDEHEMLQLCAQYARGDPAGDGVATGTFRLGEGLIGEAARGGSVRVLDDVPDGYLRVRSGLGEAPPSHLALVPLSFAGQAVGIAELGFFSTWTSGSAKIIETVTPTIASALMTSRSRAALRKLLEETQQQAERLVLQEEELRVNNQELLSQQEELRRANAELETQRETLGVQNVELEEARHRIQQKVDELAQISAYKSQFLANMSHELRTPMNSMLLLSHLLAQNETGNLTDKQVLHCRTIHSAGEDLLALINQVLDLAKIEAGRQAVHLEECALDRFTERARRVFEPLAAERGLELVVDLDPKVDPTIVTDVGRLDRILTNLLGNAIKFTEQGRVSLSVRRADGAMAPGPNGACDAAIAFSVADTGPGIAPGDRERVFAPFEQLETHADNRGSGTGLGLTIVEESVSLLGGEIRLESELGRGSVFTVYLPARTTTAEIPRQLAAPKGDRESESECDVLVIEDDAVIAGHIVKLAAARGLSVDTASTGEDGIRKAKALSPRGIVLDVKLPDTDGWTVMKALQNEPATSTIPVHVLSALDEQAKALSLGAIGYLTKPASRSELTEMITALTGDRRPWSPRVLIVEDDPREGASVVELLAREGVGASLVGSAAEALDALGRERFECIILDLGLPDVDGVVLIESLAESQPEAPPIIVHTGRAMTKRETRQVEAYAKAVVLKDGSSAERLLDEVRLFLRHLSTNTPLAARGDAPEPRVVRSLEGQTLLVVEDDMRTAYALSALLRGKGAEVVVAENGREALELLDQHPTVCGVVMDVMMPEMDGYETMRRLREEGRWRGIPIIALTARAMSGERERCIAAGASEYLAKPVDGEQLLAALDKLLQQGEGVGDAT